MLHAVFFRGAKNAFPFDGSGADFRKVFRGVVLHLRYWKAWLAVFQMKQFDALAVSLEHLQRILSGLCDPIAIHLDADQFGIRQLHKSFETSGIAESKKFVVVVVESKFHSCLMHLLAPNIKL